MRGHCCSDSVAEQTKPKHFPHIFSFNYLIKVLFLHDYHQVIAHNRFPLIKCKEAKIYRICISMCSVSKTVGFLKGVKASSVIMQNSGHLMGKYHVSFI